MKKENKKRYVVIWYDLLMNKRKSIIKANNKDEAEEKIENRQGKGSVFDVYESEEYKENMMIKRKERRLGIRTFRGR